MATTYLCGNSEDQLPFGFLSGQRARMRAQYGVRRNEARRSFSKVAMNRKAAQREAV
jgi:hypothetical protein